MERLLNQYDKEYMKVAMLKHEETFRQQVYELHRLYRIQKMLMKDVASNPRMDPHCRISNPGYNQPESRFGLEEAGGNSESECDHGDLELTLGPRSYYQKKIKATIQSDNSWPSFSSSSTGSSQIKGGRSAVKQQKWGVETTVSNQDRLNSPPWLLQALSLNMT